MVLPVSETSSAGELVLTTHLTRCIESSAANTLSGGTYSQQLLSKNEASKAFGGLLAIPDIVGNLGLGCTVSNVNVSC